MALFDQQQQEEEQPNQIQPYGVCVGNRRVRIVQHVPYVPDVNMGRPLFRARQQPAYPVREQQHVMLQDRINQDVQHNMIQDNIAYNRRLYEDPQVMSPNRPEEDAPMVNPLNGPQNEQRGPEVLYQQNTLIQQVVHFESDPELRHLVQGNDASIEQIIQEIIQIKRTMGHMSQVLTEAFAGVRGGRPKSEQESARFGQSNGLIADQIAGNLSRNYASFTFRAGTAKGTMPQGRI